MSIVGIMRDEKRGLMFCDGRISGMDEILASTFLKLGKGPAGGVGIVGDLHVCQLGLRIFAKDKTTSAEKFARKWRKKILLEGHQGGGEALIATKDGRSFKVDSEGGIFEADPSFSVVGSGAHVALGYEMGSGLAVTTLHTQCLVRACGKVVLTVGGEVFLLDVGPLQDNG